MRNMIDILTGVYITGLILSFVWNCYKLPSHIRAEDKTTFPDIESDQMGIVVAVLMIKRRSRIWGII